MRFLVDAELPPALTRWLKQRGETAEHVADLGLLEADDDTIWSLAGASGATIVSKDEDFAVGANTRAGGPRVVWIRSGNLRKPELLRRLEELWPEVVDALRRGEPLVEVV